MTMTPGSFRPSTSSTRCEAQALRGGLGVVLDDLIAGVYALVLIMGARMLFGVPR